MANNVYQLFPDVEIVNPCVHNLIHNEYRSQDVQYLVWTYFRSFLRASEEDIICYSVLHDNNRLFMLRQSLTFQTGLKSYISAEFPVKKKPF